MSMYLFIKWGPDALAVCILIISGTCLKVNHLALKGTVKTRNPIIKPLYPNDVLIATAPVYSECMVWECGTKSIR